MKNIGIIDYGMGNIQSVANALLFLGYSPIISSNVDTLNQCNGYILPGVGAFAEAMHNLKYYHLDKWLNHRIVKDKKPILGICLGMQLMAKSSQEIGLHEGLGWIDATVVAIPTTVRVPHVGWNNTQSNQNSTLFTQNTSPHFYFDHSYHFVCTDPNLITATCDYGSIQITAAIEHSHIFATQFHPEKSHKEGLKLLRRFLNYVEEYPC